MAIHINSGKLKSNNNYIENKEIKVQSMPFKILADFEADISSYFDKYVKVDDDKHYSASFRGYPLIGKKLSIPDGYIGVILHERRTPVTDKEDRNLYVINKFNSLLYWNWDSTPSKNDPLLQALDDWFDIADALHSPVLE